MDIKELYGVPYIENEITYMAKSFRSKYYIKSTTKIKVCTKSMNMQKFIEAFMKGLDFFSTVYIIFKGINGEKYIKPLMYLELEENKIPYDNILFLFAVSPNNKSFRMWYKEKNNDTKDIHAVPLKGIKFKYDII